VGGQKGRIRGQSPSNQVQLTGPIELGNPIERQESEAAREARISGLGGYCCNGEDDQNC